MDSGALLHQVIDVFALLVGILGLISLFIDPKDESRRQRFFRIALVCVILGIGLYLAVESFIMVQDRRHAELQVNKKEDQVMRLLCTKGEMNYEELYNETSAGFADDVLNSAIDDLAQNKQVLTTSWPSTAIPALKDGRSLPVRLYKADDSVCQKIR